VLLVDGLGRVTTTIQTYQDGQVASDEPVDQDLITRTVYDVAGRRVATLDPGGRETRFAYDLRNNLIAVTENATDGTCANAPCNVVTQYQYDRAGNRIRVIDARGITTQQATYDAADRQISLTDGLGTTTTTRYDRLGRMIGTDDPRGPDNDLTYGYDELDRPTSISATNLDAPIRMQYDALGRRTGLTDGTGTTSVTHDALGRITGITAPDTGSIGYAYNARGQRSGLTYPDGTAVTYTYHADGQMHQVLQGSDTLATYAYDSTGRMDTLTRSNGAVTAFAYDNADRLTDLQTTVGVTTTSHFQYSLDRMGRRTVITETLLPAAPAPAPTPTPDPYPAPTTEAAPPRPVIPQTRTIAYTYDGLNRLTGATETPGTTYDYTYDLAGNRTEVRENDALVADLRYNDANQVIGWSYDAAGNLLSDGTTTRSYDALNRLVAQAERGAACCAPTPTTATVSWSATAPRRMPRISPRR